MHASRFLESAHAALSRRGALSGSGGSWLGVRPAAGLADLL